MFFFKRKSLHEPENRLKIEFEKHRIRLNDIDTCMNKSEEQRLPTNSMNDSTLHFIHTYNMDIYKD